MTDDEKRRVEENIKLVSYLMKNYSWTNENYEDYFQVGCYGLCIAAQKFDDNRGIAFSAYASRWIIGCMLRYHRDFGQGLIRPTRKRNVVENADKPKYIYVDGLINEKGNEFGYETIQVGESKEDEIVANLALNEIRRRLTKREEAVMDLSLQGKGQCEIAKAINKSQAEVCRTKKGLKIKINEFLSA